MNLANVKKSNGLLMGPASQDRGFFVCGLYEKYGCCFARIERLAQADVAVVRKHSTFGVVAVRHDRNPDKGAWRFAKHFFVIRSNIAFVVAPLLQAGVA